MVARLRRTRLARAAPIRSPSASGGSCRGDCGERLRASPGTRSTFSHLCPFQRSQVVRLLGRPSMHWSKRCPRPCFPLYRTFGSSRKVLWKADSKRSDSQSRIQVGVPVPIIWLIMFLLQDSCDVGDEAKPSTVSNHGTRRGAALQPAAAG